MKTFEELGIAPEIQQAVKELGFEFPMPVQEEVIPYLLQEESNNDLIALAQTGTGKTAAFGLPILQRIDIKNKKPQALILCPTRELCLQIADDLNDYSLYINDLKILPVYGGSSIENQINNLKKGVHIIVATPGRLIDLLNRKAAKLAAVRNVVLDEADEMLNMGFSESIDTILAETPDDKNTLLFSATMPKEIERIARNYMKNPVEITIGTKNEGAKNIKHVYYLVHARDKYLVLKRIADYYPNIYGIIFCRTRKETQEVADSLIQDGYNADALHGDLSQAQRDSVMQKFRIRNLQLLVATDVAARGLDVDDLTHIINYGLPDDTESYTHRSGRTGRAGKSGVSIAIIHTKEKGKVKAIERLIGKKFESKNVPSGSQICEKQLFNLVDKLERVEVNEPEIATILPAIIRKLEWLSQEDLIKRVVSFEFNRLIDYYSKAKEIDQPSDRPEQKKEYEKSDRRTAGGNTNFVRIFINLGKTDGLYPAPLIDFINRNVSGRVHIGKIDLMKNFSFFEIEERSASALIKSLNNSQWQGRRVQVEIAQEKQSEKPYRRNSHRQKSFGNENTKKHKRK
ncbi:MAG: DEAD/DEAH box helicase [Bacteroidales bacterium]|jgi:ATP-dependent RNA helicase DeaD|nr:DEAD/DEAH box helicase [Bacteroidales bacterium]